MKKPFLTLFFMAFAGSLFAQSSIRDSVLGCFMVSANYAYEMPFADMKVRFGHGNMIGGGVSYKTHNNWYIGAEGEYLFGRKVKETGILDSLYTKDTLLIGYNGSDGQVALQERGYSFEGKIGRLIPIKRIGRLRLNPNTGILVTVGAGFLQHKIDVVDVDQILYQLDGAYAKGYDRLTNGFMITQSVMFLNLDSKRLLNFKIGLDLKEAFTMNRRTLNFDTRTQDTSHRLDILLGLKVEWVIPFWGKSEERFYTR